MRHASIIIALLFALAKPSYAQQDEFPYTAIVLNNQTKVYSGPGDMHYATHALDENDLVEVYRHDPGGWCAIRPPAKSFSLIPETAVKRLSKQIGEVLVDGSQAWVGTALGAVENPLWQVKLKKGERVAIVGEAAWPRASGKTTVWLQIEPPAGEYRWVKKSDLQLPPATDTITRTDYSEPPKLESKRTTVAAKTESRASKPDSAKPTFSSQAIVSTSTSGWKASTRPIPKAEPVKRDYASGTFKRASSIGSEIPMRSPNSRGFDDEIEQTSFLDDRPSDPRFESWDGAPIPKITQPSRSLVREQPIVAATPKPIAPQSRVAQTAPASTSDRSMLIAIEDQLSKEMLKEPHSWNLSDLKFQTERAKARSQDPVERLALQHVLEKISRCDGLCKNYQQASPFASAGRAPVSNPTAANATYDAPGWLKKLASSSGSMDPVFVLQDSLGNVTHEIAGSVGTNLGGYLNKRVGVMGRRGFNRRLNLNHVTAERVIVLR